MKQEEGSSTPPQTASPTAQKRKKIHWIPVVAGFLRKGDLVLLGQRPVGDYLAGMWEFPGGKIESGEGPEEALVREFREELGIESQVGDLKLSVTHNFGDTNIIILFYEIRFWKGEPKKQHHRDLKWVHPKDLGTHEIPEANRKILPRLLAALGVE